MWQIVSEFFFELFILTYKVYHFNNPIFVRRCCGRSSSCQLKLNLSRWEKPKMSFHTCRDFTNSCMREMKYIKIQLKLLSKVSNEFDFCYMFNDFIRFQCVLIMLMIWCYTTDIGSITMCIEKVCNKKVWAS